MLAAQRERASFLVWKKKHVKLGTLSSITQNSPLVLRKFRHPPVPEEGSSMSFDLLERQHNMSNHRRDSGEDGMLQRAMGGDSPPANHRGPHDLGDRAAIRRRSQDRASMSTRGRVATLWTRGEGSHAWRRSTGSPERSQRTSTASRTYRSQSPCHRSRKTPQLRSRKFPHPPIRGG